MDFQTEELYPIQNEHIVPVEARGFDQQLFDGKNHCFVLRGLSPDRASFVKFDDVVACIERRYCTSPRAT